MAPAKTAASSRTRFTHDDDLALLCEVRAVNPFADQAGWASVATNVKIATEKEFSQRALRDRLDLLLAQYRRNDRTNMRKSGTEERYTAKDQLLQEISQLADAFGHKIRLTAARKVACVRPQSSVISAAEPSTASVARDTAAATHVVHLTDATVVEEADFTCAKRAAESGNLAFFEKRLQYEKSIRVTECSIEERKIVLA
ncbi:hypothetical protein HPB49_020147 [Dermacentor silvarum]|uniref:Uncharacterized protein n=1 Tax=Dermacentor silvarum TaxID=543639 RepID=A0ACB8D7V1_DERSI|nr:hypothetical protein HPB49_020147 [Dermacentor silvarum]